MAQKIDFFGQLTPTGVDDSQVRRLRQLAGFAEQIGQTAFKIGAKISEAEGRREGAASVKKDDSGKIIPPEMRSDFTIKGQAFNEAAILAHRAEVRRDTRTELNRLQEEHKLDPHAFRKSADAYLQGTVSNMAPDMASVIGEDIKNEITERGIQLEDFFFAREHQQNIATIKDEVHDLRDDILNAARNGDEEVVERKRRELLALTARGVQTNLIGAEEAAVNAERLLEDITSNRLMGQAQGIVNAPNVDPDQKMVALTALMDSTRKSTFKDLRPEARDALASQVQGVLNQFRLDQSLLEAQERKESAQEIIKMKLSLSEPSTDFIALESQTWDMLRNQQLSEGEALGLLNGVREQQSKRMQNIDDDSAVTRRLSGDLSQVVSQKQVDGWWSRNGAEILSSLETPDQVSALIINTTRSLGIMPQQAKSMVINGLESDSPELIKDSAIIMRGLMKTPGINERVFSPQQRVFGEIVADLSGVMEVEKAVDLARRTTSPVNKALVEQRELDLKTKEFQKRNSSSKKIDDAFGGGIFSEVASLPAQADMAREYKVAFETYYKVGATEDRAHEMALSDINRNYKFSPAANDYLKHAPETFYQVSGKSGFIRDQLIAETFQDNLFDEGVLGSDLILLSDDETDKLAAMGQPDYLVQFRAQDGSFRYLIGANGLPMRWRPDVQAEEKRVKAENEKLKITATDSPVAAGEKITARVKKELIDEEVLDLENRIAALEAQDAQKPLGSFKTMDLINLKERLVKARAQ